MLASFPVAVLAGAALGFLSGLGVGGGSLLVLWLTFVLGMDQAAVRSINLLFFIPSALIACLFRWKQGILNFKVILPAAVAGCTSAWLFSQVGAVLDSPFLRKFFGVMLIFTGLSEIFRKKT